MLQKQYLSLAQLRAIETSRDLISVANTGPSGAVFASGEVLKVIEPPKRQAGIKVENVGDLVEKLKNEAGVI